MGEAEGWEIEDRQEREGIDDWPHRIMDGSPVPLYLDMNRNLLGLVMKELC